MRKLIVLLFLVLFACVQPTITNFEECAAAGNPVMESYPEQCMADGQTFVREVPICEDKCGDGVCDIFVCQSIGCPCAESKESCPEDCA